VPVEPETPVMPTKPELRVDVGTEAVVPVEVPAPVIPSKPVANKTPPVEPEPIFNPIVAIEPASS
jgi:hypothetical protein